MTGELNPRFDFENFKIGVGNELALTASRAVAERPGSVYNPLYIHGGNGLGKTHLLMAIGRSAQQRAEPVTVEYVTPDRLAEEFQAVASAGQSDALRNRLADLDVLLIDDVHMVAERTELHTELLRLLPELQATSKQIVLAGICLPGQIPGLDERIVGILAGGLVVEINPPDFQTRLDILQERAEERGCQFESGVIETVAEFAIDNVSELITLLNRLVALEAVGETSLTAGAARTLLQGEALTIEQREPAVPAATEPTQTAGEFEDFLSDVSSAVQMQIDSWESHLGEAIERFRSEGFETGRLESLLEQSSPVPVEAAIDEFERDVTQLRKLRTSVAAEDPTKAQDAVFRDPDRVAEAQAIAGDVTTELGPPPGPSAAWNFETYVESDVNGTANRLARQVVQSPASDHNPLVIVGKTGVGKTHLLNAIGNGLCDLKLSPVACISATDFHDGLTRATESGRLDDWLAMLGNVQALLVDDVHILTDKGSTAERLLDLLKALLDVPRQAVFTLNAPVADIEGLPSELQSVLENATTATLSAPDRHLRRALAVRLLEGRLGYADPELADYLGDRPADSARAVTGLLQRVFAAAESQGVAPNAMIARELIEGAVPKVRRPSATMRTSGILISPSGGVKSREKMIWNWPDPADRLIEELS
jgi:chromosomal replication initiation ATPase DnaA